ncbi:MAG TPA: c-type cytochrome [Anaerolineae bacterium]|nr:c-type cytochrome [Anaerolineae bacterium]
MNAERLARLMVFALAIVLPVIALVAGNTESAAGQTIEIHGVMSEVGGWTPADLTATVGQPLHLRLTSDDVMHGFAVGQTDWPAIDVKPGEITETTLRFDTPGKYTFYCTRWCGPNHWRMRGMIEVSGPGAIPAAEPPLYVTLGLDIDAPHEAQVIPDRMPSAARGAQLGVTIPKTYLTTDTYRAHSPAQVWQELRAEPFTRDLTDAQVWDLVAFIWQSNTTPQPLEVGRKLYAANCAACHGETGAGDGVMAESLTGQAHGDLSRDTQTPADFTDAVKMLGASPALLQGKMVRGGMGTGMPYWGPIFTDSQSWAIDDYLWTFQFQTYPYTNMQVDR